MYDELGFVQVTFTGRIDVDVLNTADFSTRLVDQDFTSFDFFSIYLDDFTSIGLGIYRYSLFNNLIFILPMALYNYCTFRLVKLDEIGHEFIAIKFTAELVVQQ